jgi:hypothetical protein
MRRTLGLSLVLGLGCAPTPPPAPPHRVALHRTGGTTFELVPAEGQLPHCLAYTVNAKGLTRQLTMSRHNESFACPAGRPVAGHAYRVPLTDGPVKVIVLFTSAPVNAASVSQQLLDLPDRRRLTAMELRLPGAASLELLDFSPEEDVAPTEGQELRPDAGAPGSDAADAG